MDFPIAIQIPLNRTASGIPTVSLRWAPPSVNLL